MSLQAEIHYLQIENQGEHTNESIMLKNVLSVRIRQMNKAHLMDCKK